MTEKPKLKEWQDQLLRELGKYLPEYGFSPKAVGNSFRRKTPYGHDLLHINFGKYTHYLTAAANIALRVDALEDLRNEYDPKRAHLSKKEQRETASFGGELGNLSVGRWSSWTIRSPEEISSTAAEIMQMFREIAIPYFEKYSDLETMYQILARNDREGSKHSPFNDVRCKDAVGLAYLLNKVTEMEELIERNDKYLRENDDDEIGLEAYRRFIQAIRVKQSRK